MSNERGTYDTKISYITYTVNITYNAVSEYRVVWKPRYKKRRFTIQTRLIHSAF